MASQVVRYRRPHLSEGRYHVRVPTASVPGTKEVLLYPFWPPLHVFTAWPGASSTKYPMWWERMTRKPGRRSWTERESIAR